MGTNVLPPNSAVSVPSGTVTTTGSPANGNLAKFSGSSTVTNGNLSGDITTTDTLVATLANSGAVAGTYGNSTNVSRVTVNAKGLITSITEVGITTGGTGTVTTTGSPTNGTLTGFSGSTSITNVNLSGDVTTSGSLSTTLAASGVSAGTYGSASANAVITVDAKGRVTSATTATPNAVAGPNGATDNAIVRFDTTTGKLLQNSGITIADGASGVLSGTNTGDQTVVQEFGFEIGDGTNPITTGISGVFPCRYSGTIIDWTLLSVSSGFPSGSIQIALWKAPYASFPPNSGNTITGSAPPTLSSTNKNTSTTLTGWTTSVTAGDIFVANVNSVSGLTKVILVVKINQS